MFILTRHRNIIFLQFTIWNQTFIELTSFIEFFIKINYVQCHHFQFAYNFINEIKLWKSIIFLRHHFINFKLYFNCIFISFFHFFFIFFRCGDLAIGFITHRCCEDQSTSKWWKWYQNITKSCKKWRNHCTFLWRCCIICSNISWSLSLVFNI